MSNPLVRIGFLGIAHMHSVSYAHSLLAMPGVEVVGMWDRTDKLAAEWSSRLGVPRFASAGDLLAAGLDAVVVCSENAYHRRWSSRPRVTCRPFFAKSQFLPPLPMRGR